MKFLRIFGYAALIGTVSTLSFNPALAQESTSDEIDTLQGETGIESNTIETEISQDTEVGETEENADISQEYTAVLAALDTGVASNIDSAVSRYIRRLRNALQNGELTQEEVDEAILSVVEQMTNRDTPAELRPVVAQAIRSLSTVASTERSSGLVQVASTYEDGDDIQAAATDQAASEQ